jgi:hypothetical protein
MPNHPRTSQEVPTPTLSPRIYPCLLHGCQKPTLRRARRPSRQNWLHVTWRAIRLVCGASWYGIQYCGSAGRSVPYTGRTERYRLCRRRMARERWRLGLRADCNLGDLAKCGREERTCLPSCPDDYRAGWTWPAIERCISVVGSHPVGNAYVVSLLPL